MRERAFNVWFVYNQLEYLCYVLFHEFGLLKNSIWIELNRKNNLCIDTDDKKSIKINGKDDITKRIWFEISKVLQRSLLTPTEA